MQICSVDLIVRKLETKVMEVVPNRLSMDSQTVLTQYIIKNWTLDYVDQNDPSRGITMVLVFRRRIMNAILTIYLPTILVLCIVYATNFFKEFFFEATQLRNVKFSIQIVKSFTTICPNEKQVNRKKFSYQKLTKRLLLGDKC